jgi:hypothetical protein
MAIPVLLPPRRRGGHATAFLLAVLLLLVGWISPAAAQLRLSFLPAMGIVPDARSLGMGCAFTAVAEGPSAAWWNPGALGIPSPWSVQVATDIGKSSWIGSDDLGVYALSAQFRGTGVAAHVVTLGEEDAFGFNQRRKRDSLVHVGAGTDLAGRIGLGSPGRIRWGVGGAVKRYAISFRPGEFQTSQRSRASGIDADAGSLLAIRVPLGRDRGADLFAPRGPTVPFAGLRAGAVLRGVFGSKVDLTTSPGGETLLDREMWTGVAVEAGTAGWKRLGPVVAGTVSAEMKGDLENDGDSPTRCLGVEVRILDLLSLRYGETRDERWDFKGISRGVGLRIGLPWRAGIRLDWARASVPHWIYWPEMGRGDLRQFSGSIWFLP